jgi:putative transposase
MIRTVSLPIEILRTRRFFKLMKLSAEIFNIHVDWALHNKTYSKKQAHRDLYAILRIKFPDVPSALVQTTRDNALEAVKSTKFKKTPRKHERSALRYDVRTLKLRGEQLTLSTIGEREQLIIAIPEHFQAITEIGKLKGGTLVYNKYKKQFFIKLVYDLLTPLLRKEGKVVGIDRGIHYEAVTSEGVFHSNKQRRAVQRRYLYNRRTLQTKGTPSSRRRLKQMAKKEQRFSRNESHRIAKSIVETPGIKTIVLENLKGIRNRNLGKKTNKRISSWPFYEFERCLSYKAEAQGIEVAHVTPEYTSQQCSKCHVINKGNRYKSKYHCSNCGLRMHAELNAAINIRNRYLLSSTSSDVGKAGFGQ